MGNLFSCFGEPDSHDNAYAERTDEPPQKKPRNVESMTSGRKVALLVIDVQNDFLPGGSLAVAGGDEIIPIINKLMKDVEWDEIFFSQDWHPAGHSSFSSSNPGTELFQLKNGLQVMWPDHCIQGTFGAEFHKDLDRAERVIVVQKGTNLEIDSYSAFWDNGKLQQTELERLMKERGITVVFVCGLATDYCVQFSAHDSLESGFETYLINDASRGISQEGIDKALESFKQKGGRVVDSSETVHLARA